MTAKRSRTTAFTLIEAIISVVVISIAVPPTLWAIGDSTVSRVAPLQISTARWLAIEKMEDVIADRHSVTRGYAYLVNSNYTPESSVSGFTGYARTVSITETGASLAGSGTGYKTIVVTVTWSDYRKVSRSLAVSSVVTNY